MWPILTSYKLTPLLRDMNAGLRACTRHRSGEAGALPHDAPEGYQDRRRAHRSFVRWGAPPMRPAPLLIGRCLRREGEPAQARGGKDAVVRSVR